MTRRGRLCARVRPERKIKVAVEVALASSEIRTSEDRCPHSLKMIDPQTCSLCIEESGVSVPVRRLAVDRIDTFGPGYEALRKSLGGIEVARERAREVAASTVTVTEACKLAGVTEHTLRRADDELQPIRVGNRRRYDRERLLAWAEQRRRVAA